MSLLVVGLSHRSAPMDLVEQASPGDAGAAALTAAVRAGLPYALAAPGGGAGPRAAHDTGLKLNRVSLLAAAGNTASHRVAEKAGFTRTGIEREAELLGDNTVDDLVLYDVLADPQTKQVTS